MILIKLDFPEHPRLKKNDPDWFLKNDPDGFTSKTDPGIGFSWFWGLVFLRFGDRFWGLVFLSFGDWCF